MIFVSAHFGPIAVDESSILEFPLGLPGFEERRRFLPLQHGEPGGLLFLQSLERADLCFLAMPVRSVRPDYRLLVTVEDLEVLELPPARQPEIGKDVAALAIVSVVEGGEPTVNLRSPVVIHMRTRRAVQAIRPDDRYQVKEPLVEEAVPVCS